jgi:hypothetical protein
MAIGFAVGSALLLSAASIVPGLRARDERTYGRYGIQAGRHAADALLIWYLPQSVGDLDIQASVVQAIGDAPVPPGLTQAPRPGEIFVSERLGDLWSGSVGATLERRLDGHLAGTIGRAGVDGPEVLSLWVGKPDNVDLPRSDASAVRAFGQRRWAIPLDLASLFITIIIASALLLPIWLFVATATRLSAATREARLASVRLAGGTEAEVRILAGVESGVAAAIGSVFGIPLFLFIRPALANGAIANTFLYAPDLTPPIAVAVFTLIALPLLAIGLSLLTMRRLIVSPLGVARRARRSHPGWRWIVVLVIGIAVLAWCASQHAAIQRLGDIWVMVLVGSSLASIAFGLVGTATWLAWAIARHFAGSVHSAWAMLGMRRLEAEPTSVSRVVGGIALMIAMVGVVQAGFLSVERDEASVGSPAAWTRSLAPGTDIASSDGSIYRAPIPDVSGVPGVISVRWTHEGPFGDRSSLRTAVIETDGTSATLEAVRDRLVWSGAAVHPVGQLKEPWAVTGDTASIRRGAMAITLFLLLVSAATLLVAMVDWVMERRRSLAVLSAVGVSGATVRRSIFAQVALPLATSISFGVAGALLVTTLVYAAVEQKVVIPTQQLIVLVIAVVAIVFVVTALSAPWLKMARRPELLREA